MSNTLTDVRVGSHREANSIIKNSGGEPLEEPKNIPKDWIVEVIDQRGIKYSNPSNEDEFVKVMPGNLRYTDVRYHEPYAIYHYPTPLIGKEFMDKIYFNQTDPEHMHILRNLEGIDNLRVRATEAGTVLEKFWFKLEDIIFIRKTLGFKPIQEHLLRHIKKILCECHQIALSDTQGGVRFCSPNPHEGARVAHHISKGEGVFVKVGSTRGYHTLAGKTMRHNDNETHIYNIDGVLRDCLDWYLPHCKKFYRLKKFDYYKARMTIASFNEEGSKSIYVQGVNGG